MEPLLERDRELEALDAALAGGGVLVVEGGAGIGKTSLLGAARHRGKGLGREVLLARGSELEEGFAFGVVRQLFERRLAGAPAPERDELLAGPAASVRPLLGEAPEAASADDISFSVLHGLYWLTANLAARRAVVVVVDDAHWVDEPSRRWLAYLAARLDGLPVTLLVALRPAEPASGEPPLLAVRGHAARVLRPRLLSAPAVARIARSALGVEADEARCAELARASGGNPLYLRELVRAHAEGRGIGGRGLAPQVEARIRRLGPRALALAQALAVLGDGGRLAHGAVVAGVDAAGAARLAAELTRAEILADGDPPRFLHPVIREAVESSLAPDRRDAAHRVAAGLLELDRAPPGQVAAHLLRVRPVGDPWVVATLRRAAGVAMEAGAPRAAAELLARALLEPPAPAERVGLLREAARAEATAGSGAALGRLEAALALAVDPVERAAIILEVAEASAALFRWVDAVDALERALDELGDADPALAARLEGELIVAGLHDARRASRVGPVLERLAARPARGAPAEALAVARGMAAVLAGRPAGEAAAPLEAALAEAAPRAENWDTRAALLWSLVTAERFAAVEAALGPMEAEVRRSGSARGLVAVLSTLALLRLRLGALPEADAAARAAMSVVREGDFAPGLPFVATVLADVDVEAGEPEEAEALLGLLPQDGWPPGVGTVLIPAARGRLRLAQGRAAEALADFATCGAMFSAEVWGTPMRDVGYLHARSGAAHALLQLDRREEADALAEAELADVRTFAGPRALGIALRTSGLVRGGEAGIERLQASVETLAGSPALLERARSLAELGAALRRAGRRAEARGPLADALDLAARCGARPLAARAREELRAAGARPRREWRRGVEALTPSELRVARLAAEGRTNREIAHALYVTLKTVEGHLARAYGKLGIAGRPELGDALGEKTRVGTPSRGGREVGQGPVDHPSRDGGPP